MRIRRFDAVFFDLGNTLLYFDGDWGSALLESNYQMYKALVGLGYQVPQEDFIQSYAARMMRFSKDREADFFEYTSAYILRGLLSDYGYRYLPEGHIREALAALYAVTQSHWRLEDDALSMLNELKNSGYGLALISNAGDAADVHLLLKQNELTPFFDPIVISAEVRIRKPHPMIFSHAMAALAAEPNQVVMVGDTLGADILGARNAGIASVWITRRANRTDNQAHQDTILPDRIISSLAELPELLANWPD